MDEDALEAVPADNRSTHSEPQSFIEACETNAVLEGVVGQLPQALREVFLLSRYQGLSNREIASVLGISDSATKVRLFRALAQLRAALRMSEKTADEAGNG